MVRIHHRPPVRGAQDTQRSASGAEFSPMLPLAECQKLTCLIGQMVKATVLETVMYRFESYIGHTSGGLPDKADCAIVWYNEIAR